MTLLACRDAQRFIVDQLGVEPILPRSIWHRMNEVLIGVETAEMQAVFADLQTCQPHIFDTLCTRLALHNDPAPATSDLHVMRLRGTRNAPNRKQEWRSRPTFCGVEQLSPTMANEHHWVEGLNGKRVLMVSPFKLSIEKYIVRLRAIWKGRLWDWNADFVVQKFPYSIDEDCSRS